MNYWLHSQSLQSLSSPLQAWLMYLSLATWWELYEDFIEYLTVRSCKNHEEGIFCFLLLISLKQTPATAKAKILHKYPDLVIAIDWKKLYSLAFETKLNTKLRELQYKILNLIIFMNKRLHWIQNGGFPFMCLSLQCWGGIPGAFIVFL